MSRKNLFAACLVACIAARGAAYAQVRDWEDQSGTVRFSAEFERLDGTSVHLRTPDGQTRKVPLQWLSTADQEVVEKAATPAGADFTGDGQAEVVIAEGAGLDVEAARKDAYRNAVRQAVGAYVDSETVVANDQLITDKVITLSPAFVEKVEPIAGAEKREDGLVRVRVRAHVRITKLLDALAAGNVKTRPVTRRIDTQSLLAEFATKSDQHEARHNILAKLCRDYPESCLTVTQSGKEAVDKRPDGSTVLNVPITITPNAENFAIFATTLCEVLSATKRTSGEFKVDGKRLGPDARYAKDGLQRSVSEAFTDPKKMLQVFPNSLQESIRRSSDARGHTPLAGIGPVYLLWDGSDRPGVDSLYYGAWQDSRANNSDDWILVCMVSAKKNFSQTSWRWFHITADEYQEWFANVPGAFRCKTQLVDHEGNEVAGDVIEIAQIGAARQYPRLLWVVPFFVNGTDTEWYTPEIRLLRSLDVDADDASRIAALKLSLQRCSSPSP